MLDLWALTDSEFTLRPLIIGAQGVYLSLTFITVRMIMNDTHLSNIHSTKSFYLAFEGLSLLLSVSVFLCYPLMGHPSWIASANDPKVLGSTMVPLKLFSNIAQAASMFIGDAPLVSSSFTHLSAIG
jgi:hypothetical protein